MYKQIIGFDCRGLEDAQVLAFIHNAAEAIGVGPGSKSHLAAAFRLEPKDVLRFVIGVPDTWLDEHRQRFAEAVYAYTFRTSLTKAHDAWGTEGHWSPINPRAHDDLANNVLDLEFMDQFGLPDKAWDGVLHMSAIVSRTKRCQDSSADRLRAVLGLLEFGFPDPMQFFMRK